jgi:HEAT repeat protein
MSSRTERPRADVDDARIAGALRAEGIHVSSIFDLVNSPDPRAIPVLLRFLDQDLDPWVKEGLVRALSIKEARRLALLPMISEFKRPNLSDSLRWSIGNAIEVLATEEVLGELVEIVRDKRYGRARQMVVLGIAKLKGARQDTNALDALCHLLDEDEVRGHAIAALGRLRAPGVREKVAQFVAHPNAWIRREAKKALKRIDST